MIELLESEIRESGRPSSKGNQLKWKHEDYWYKSDYCGYEGFAEYVVSEILGCSTLDKKSYVKYETEQMKFKHRILLGCKSHDFQADGWNLITVERLFRENFSQSLHDSIFAIENVTDRIRFMVENIEKITGLKEFGKYLSTLFEIDMITLNEDRHTHNIAVLRNDFGEYDYCPIFDNGAGLLSDTSVDFPMEDNVEDLVTTVHSASVAFDFEEQAEAAEQLYGIGLKFNYRYDDLWRIVDKESYYSDAIKQRVLWILNESKRKYPYLFTK